PQFAAIMGNCVAGGGYLPVLCDTLLMTEGSGLYLAGPALVKAAIGQVVDHESLGGAKMHAGISGTIDFREKDDQSCLERLKRLVGALPKDSFSRDAESSERSAAAGIALRSEDSASRLSGFTQAEYEVRDLLKLLLD